MKITNPATEELITTLEESRPDEVEQRIKKRKRNNQVGTKHLFLCVSK